MYDPDPASFDVSHAAAQSLSFSCFFRSAEFTTWISGTIARKIDAGATSVNWTVYLSTAFVPPGATIFPRTDAAPFLPARIRSRL